MLPRILVIDDQYARDDAERGLFLRQLNAIEDGRQSRNISKPVAKIFFCSGQEHTKEEIKNSYSVIQGAVTSGLKEKESSWALVMLDVRFDSGALSDGGLPLGQPDDDHFGEIVRQRLKQDFFDLPVIMLSGKRQQELHENETPYLSKDRLDEKAFKGCLLRYGDLSVDQTRRLLGLAGDIVVNSDSSLANYREAFAHASNDIPILILGETGTGKEVLAKYIHQQSGWNGPYVAVNVTAIPSDLLESELFGIERGTATGVDRRSGKFEQANGGTLFLDEIGDMSLNAQSKVLRALQEREIYRVGGREPIALDVRLVCATSRNLSSMIAQGTFREDLYYRINAIQLKIAPLRDRRKDIFSLIEVFLTQAMSPSGKVGITFSPDAITVLESHRFPGNVRELENIVRRLASSAGNHQVISRDAVMHALGRSEGNPLIGHEGSAAIACNDIVGKPQLRQGEPATLQNISEILAQVDIGKNDTALLAAKPMLEKSYRNFTQRLAGAALERCRDPVAGKLNRQRAMQLLTGDTELKGKGPSRVINEILGRKQQHRVTEEDLELLVAIWRKHK